MHRLILLLSIAAILGERSNPAQRSDFVYKTDSFKLFLAYRSQIDIKHFDKYYTSFQALFVCLDLS